MTDKPRAGYKDIVKVTDADHRRTGERFAVINGNAGIGSRYILACGETDHDDRIGLRHDQVEIVGQVRATITLPVI